MKIHKVILVLIIFFSGCSPALKNLKQYKLDIIEYYESGKFDTEVRAAITEAMSDLKGTRIMDSSAAIFDIDETALNNYEHIKNSDFGFNSELWDKWIKEKRAPAINAVKDFYNYLLEKKVHIIFITGRSEDEYQATYENLINVGYTKFDTLIVRSEKSKSSPASNYKGIERMVLSGLGYKIIACIGDQESDISGEYTGVKVKLPNYLYIIE